MNIPQAVVITVYITSVLVAKKIILFFFAAFLHYDYMFYFFYFIDIEIEKKKKIITERIFKGFFL